VLLLSAFSLLYASKSTNCASLAERWFLPKAKENQTVQPLYSLGVLWREFLRKPLAMTRFAI
jgi:hypothetical protein